MSPLHRWSFRRLSMNARVAVVVVMVVAGLASLTVINAFDSRARQMDGLQVSLSNEIETAVSVATQFHERAVKGEMSEQEAERQALAVIHDMQWNKGKGYIFVFDTGLIMRMHPLRPEWAGKDISAETDAKGMPHYRMMSEADVKDGFGMIRYTQKLPDGSNKDKVTYSQLFKPWNLNLAAGAYFDDIDAQFQPRKMSDRPNVVPKGSTNFAMVSQFVEIPDDMVFTEEYSVRAARIAVYT
ncbi:MAG: oleate hydratase, partial [Rhodanobacter sp.]